MILWSYAAETADAGGTSDVVTGSVVVREVITINDGSDTIYGCHRLTSHC